MLPAGSGYGTFLFGVGLLGVAVMRWTARRTWGWQLVVGGILALAGGSEIGSRLWPGFPGLGDLLGPLVLILIGSVILSRARSVRADPASTSRLTRRAIASIRRSRSSASLDDGLGRVAGSGCGGDVTGRTHGLPSHRLRRPKYDFPAISSRRSLIGVKVVARMSVVRTSARLRRLPGDVRRTAR